MAGRECQLETLVKQGWLSGWRRLEACGKRRKVLASPADLQPQSGCSALGTSLGSWRNPHRYRPCAQGWPSSSQCLLEGHYGCAEAV